MLTFIKSFECVYLDWGSACIFILFLFFWRGVFVALACVFCICLMYMSYEKKRKYLRTESMFFDLLHATRLWPSPLKPIFSCAKWACNSLTTRAFSVLCVSASRNLLKRDLSLWIPELQPPLTHPVNPSPPPLPFIYASLRSIHCMCCYAEGWVS